MPAETVLHALRHVWLTLKPLEMPMAVMGGIALAVWKHVRATRDVDLLVGIAENHPNQIVERLRAAGIRPKRDPPIFSLGQLELIQFLYEPPGALLDLQIDLFLTKSHYHREALERRVLTRLPDLDIEISVLGCEDLILHKLLAGRVIDRADAAALLRANRESLELDYLLRWTGRLELASGLTEVWNEALPGEPLPAVENRPQ